MKKILTIVVLLAAHQLLFAQAKDTSKSTNPTTDTSKKTPTKSQTGKASDSATSAGSDTTGRHGSDTAKIFAPCPCGYKVLQEAPVYLVLLPIFLVIIILIFVLNALRKFDINKALSENDPPLITIGNPAATNQNYGTLSNNTGLADIIPPTIQVSAPLPAPPASPNPPSTSRLIAFLTSLVTLIIVLSMCCFFIYHYLRTGCPPDLSNLSTVLIGLGVGVLPYAANKITTAIGKRNNQN